MIKGDQVLVRRLRTRIQVFALKGSSGTRREGELGRTQVLSAAFAGSDELGEAVLCHSPWYFEG